jgi:hypothetical protein
MSFPASDMLLMCIVAVLATASLARSRRNERRIGNHLPCPLLLFKSTPPSHNLSSSPQTQIAQEQEQAPGGYQASVSPLHLLPALLLATPFVAIGSVCPYARPLAAAAFPKHAHKPVAAELSLRSHSCPGPLCRPL